MEDISFPRGGHYRPPTEKSSEIENKARSVRAKRKDVTVSTDFLFGVSNDKKARKRKSSSLSPGPSSPSKKQSLLPLGGGGVVMSYRRNNKLPLVEALSFSKLAKGTKLLGVVREVHDEFAVLSLPNLLTGYILRDEDYSSLTKCLEAGQFLAVVIVKIVTEQVGGGQQRRRIQVSAKPAALNSRSDPPIRNSIVRGRLLSAEDHGFIVDLGHGRKGFLSFDEIEGSYTVTDDEEDDGAGENESRTLQSGRLFDFLVTSSSTSSDAVIPLSLPTVSTLAKHLLVPTTTTPTLSSICPGWLVQAKVESMAKNGLCVAFFGNMYRGAVELSHIGAYFRPKTREGSIEWRDVFSRHQSFTARIVAVDVATKLIRLSIQPDLLRMEIPMGLPSVGTVVDDCTVIRLDPEIGALLALPGDYERETNPDARDSYTKKLYQDESYHVASRVRAVYVHISKAIDEKDTQSFAKQFAPSTSHKVRILSTLNWIEGIASGACSTSLLDAHVLTHSDLQPGHIYRQVPVCAHLEGGSILVNLGSGVRGLIPPMHLFETSSSSEYRRKLLKAKYAVDSKIDVRVLWVNEAKKKCLLSAKKSLLSQQHDAITSYEGLKLGQRATGYISKIDDRGLYVTFCNRVYGKVTARSLAGELGIENHRQDYQVGDVVSCRVFNLKKRVSGRHSIAVEDNEEDYDDEEEEVDRPYWELTLSLNVDGPTDADDGSALPKQVRLMTGAILPVKSMKILRLVKGKQKEKGGFVPGYAIVSIKSKHLVSESECASMLPYVECKLPFDQLADEYKPDDIQSAEALDSFAEEFLAVSKKIKQKGIILTDPRKSNVEYSSGIGKLTVVSIRKKLIEQVENQRSKDAKTSDDDHAAILPGPETHLFVGAALIGYVSQVDPRYGSFIRFLDGMTGLIPKKKGGLDIPLFDTVVTQVTTVDDSTRPMKILLSSRQKSRKVSAGHSVSVQPGDEIMEAKIMKLDFYQALLEVDDPNLSLKRVKLVLHFTMADSPVQAIKGKKNNRLQGQNEDGKDRSISKDHPFYKWKVGKKLKNLRVVFVDKTRGVCQIQLTNRKHKVSDSGQDTKPSILPKFISDKAQLMPGEILTGIVTSVDPSNKGLYLQLSPSVCGFVPALEVSTNVKILNNLKSYIPVGSRLRCSTIDRTQWREIRSKCPHSGYGKGAIPKEKDASNETIFLSLLLPKQEGVEMADLKISKPSRGDLVVGSVNRSFHPVLAPSLMLNLRGGYVGRCCITELEEVDDWVNMPLGRMSEPGFESKEGKSKEGETRSGEAVEDMDLDQETVDEDEDESESPYPNGTFVACRVLKAIPGQSIVDVSLRSSRIEGDLDEDEPPEAGEMVQGYVINTNKSGCFVRLARQTQGRVILKELCDGFLPNPHASFPMGRLIVGKVKDVRTAPKKHKKSTDPVKIQIDLDMRESTILESQDKVGFDDIKVHEKYRGTVTRVESYGVFVRIENSDVSGLAHKSECSDNFVRNLEKFYDPGDTVKVLVIKKEETEERRIGFSMKASHFADDDSSDEDSSVAGWMDEADEDVLDVESNDDDELDSDDEEFGAKLAMKLQREEQADDKSTSDDDSDSDSDSDENSHDEDEQEDSEDENEDAAESQSSGRHQRLDTDVGFDWGRGSLASTSKKNNGNSSSDDDESSSESDEDADIIKTSHKSRKKQAQRRREEQEITRRETALADGTADESPETAADFERLLAGDPNSSELWIRYMAFYLSLADIPSAREVAERAFAKIEFREEREKLNVWTALLTLELKYGSTDSLQATMDRACQYNNPKQIYLRVCEMLAKDVESSASPDSVSRADNMFEAMCKKFKSKKKVWISHLQYLLKTSRYQEAHDVLKRGLMSLAPYKHAETMSKFAQLEFEFGSAERARTVFEGIIMKYPKRLDLLFVYLDKEVKFGSISVARLLLEKKTDPSDRPKTKLSDKHMKSLFKKWYRIEEHHGNDSSREHVKSRARAYVEESSP